MLMSPRHGRRRPVSRDTRRTRMALALLLLTAVTLIALDARSGGSSLLQGARNSATSAVASVEHAVGGFTQSVSDTVGGVAGDQRAQIRKLERENAALQQRLALSGPDAAQAQQLAGLLRLAGAGQYTFVPARIIAVGAALGFESTVTIDAGARDHVQAGMTVVDGHGLVGRVRSTTTSTAVVELATDPDSIVGARLAGSAELGYVQGRGDRPMRFTLLSVTASMKPGDRLVTAGTAAGKAVLVPGVPVGTVLSVSNTPGSLTRNALVRPFVDYTSLGIVGVVVVPPRTDPRDAVLPPAPRSS
jgi:rod shape-determining protein MreC